MQKNFLLDRFLREINLGDFERSKMLFLIILEALNFDFGKLTEFLKAEIYQNAKIAASKNAKMAIL